MVGVVVGGLSFDAFDARRLNSVLRVSDRGYLVDARAAAGYRTPQIAVGKPHDTNEQRRS